MEGPQWSRLERYARWKQKRFPLDRLPEDLLAQVFTWLGNRDVRAVVDALRGACYVERASDVLDVPISIRRDWLHRMACDHLETHLQGLGTHACFLGNDPSVHVHAYANWSLFSGSSKRTIRPLPIAQYSYVNAHRYPEWTTKINHRVVERCVDRLFKKRICALRLTLHHVYVSRAVTYLVPEEKSATMCFVYPHFLIDQVSSLS